MKNNRFYKLILSLIVILIFLSLGSSVFGAFDPLDTTYIKMSDEEVQRQKEKFSLQALDKSNKQYENHFFFSFDVAADGRSVLLFDDATVVVFDKDGKVESVLKFNYDILNTRSRSAAIKWNGENLEIMLGYDVSCLFTTSGNILDIWNYETELVNIPNPSELKVGEYTYKMKSSNFWIRYTGGGNFDKFIRTDASGAEKMLFETQRKSMPDEAVFFIVLVGVFHIVIGGIAISILFSRKKKPSPSSGYNFNRRGSVPGSGQKTGDG